MSEVAAPVIEEIVDDPHLVMGREGSRYRWDSTLDTQHFVDVDPESLLLPPPYWIEKPKQPLGTTPDHPCNASLEFDLSERCSAVRNAMELVEWLKQETDHPSYTTGSWKYRIFWKKGSVELHRPSPDGRLRIDFERGEVQPEEISRAEAINCETRGRSIIIWD